VEIRTDLYIAEADRGQLKGDGPVNLVMPRGLKCAAPLETAGIQFPDPGHGVARARELASGRVVCMACQFGPCQLPDGIGHDRELRIYKEEDLGA